MYNEWARKNKRKKPRRRIKSTFLYDKCLKDGSNGSEISAPYQGTLNGALETFSAVFRDVQNGQNRHRGDARFKREERFQKVLKFENFLLR